MGGLPALLVDKTRRLVAFTLMLLSVYAIVTRFAYGYKVLIHLAVISVCAAECKLGMCAYILVVVNGREQSLVAVLINIISGDDSFCLAYGALVMIFSEYLIAELNPLFTLVEAPEATLLNKFVNPLS